MIITPPSFGNSWGSDFEIVHRDTHGGELKTVIDNQWPVLEKMSVRFPTLSTAAKNTLVNEVVAAYGTELALTDHEGVNWIGMILGNAQVVQDHRDCGWEVSFEFEGRRLQLIVMITLEYSTLSVELPNPQLGDGRAYLNKSVQHKSMNGTFWAVRRGTIKSSYSWNFQNVDRDKIIELQDFLRASKGRTYIVTSHDGTVFNAKLLNGFSTTDDSRGRCVATAGSFSLTLQEIQCQDQQLSQ